MSEWKTIDSAPKDGQYLLVCGGDTSTVYRDYEIPDDLVMVVARYDSGKEQWRFAEYDGGYLGEWPVPTHWMPLPAPPEG